MAQPVPPERPTSASASASESALPTAPEFGRGYTAYAVGLLVVVYVFNFIDRQILTILQEQIKADLQLSDTQLGLLGGLAFGLLYATLGVPIARWADRSSRRSIISLACAVWSLMTAVTGAAGSFVQIFLARVGVGIGEAGCSPPAHSLISDYVPPTWRATALSIYSLGIPFGAGVGLALGGFLADTLGWRWAFLVVGLPGIAVALLARLTLREPTRGYWEGTKAADPVHADAAAVDFSGAVVREFGAMLSVMGYMLRKPSFRHLAFAAALHALYGYGAGAFNPSFYIRSFGLSTTELGLWLGIVLGILCGGLGTLLGGTVSDWLQHRDRRWYAWVPALSTAIGVPFVFFVYLNSSPYAAFAWAAVPTIVGAMYLGPTFAMTQGLARPEMRAVAAAVLLFIINIVGLGLGPFVVGVVSDLLAPSYGASQGLAYALLGVIVTCALWSVLHYFLAARTLREDLAATAAAR